MRLLNSLQDGSIDVEFPALDMAEPLSKYGFELLGYDLQSCVIIFVLISKNRSQNVSLTSPKLHLMYGAIFLPALPKTWQECFYTTLYNLTTWHTIYK